MSRHACLSALAAILFAKAVSGHMVLGFPVPYSFDKAKSDNGPITASNFPCKSNFGYTVTTENDFNAGDQHNLSFIGSAVHGGGSCQLAVTLDREPTASSSFKVIQSYEGGCPVTDASLKFSIPNSIPNGKATFAWTWFSKLSGAPEMYMNCAPITVTGGASDDSAFKALPDMFVANIASVDCKTPQPGDTKFPNPGSKVEVGSGSSPTAPTGSKCGASVASSDSGSSSGSSPSSGSGSGSGSASSAASTAPKAAATTAASNGGGVFAPGAASSAAATPTSLTTTLVTVTASSSPAAAAVTTPASGSSSSSSSGTSFGSSSSSSSGSSTCSTQGQVVCNGSTQFGLCNNGNVVWQAVAPGTTCSNGVIQRKRDVHAKRDRMYHGRIMRPRHNHWSS